jgi:transposase
MRYYMGVDWADQADQVWVVDEAGDTVLKRSIAHTVAARREWARWLRERQAEGLELWAAIERPHGRIVDFLLEQGVLVYAINPKSLDRARDRFRVGGSKSDPFDAHVLALFLRSDHAQLRPLRPSSEAAQELQGLTRDYRHQVHLQTRLLNQLTATLKEYYPRALEVCADLTATWARAFLDRWPTPTAAATIKAAEWQRFARAHRLSPERTAAGWQLLQQPQLPLPAHVVRVKARLLQALLRELAPTLATVAEYRQAIDDFFATLPTAEIARSLPVGKAGTTVPTIWAELGEDHDRWPSFRALQGYAGCVPETERSGHAVLVKFRFACNPVLRDALHQLAFLSLSHSLWARTYYARYRARNHTHHEALRALGAKWLKIIFVLSTRHVPYSETHHLATMARHCARTTMLAGGGTAT